MSLGCRDLGLGLNLRGLWYHPVRQVELYGKVAHAMGDYTFTDATSGDKVRGSG